MADEPQTPENDEDELLLTEEVEQPEDARGEDDETDPNVNDEGDEEVFAFGDEPTEPQETDSGLVKHLRDQLKKAQKEAAEARRNATAEQPIEVGEKPTLAGCDYDEDKFEAELDGWKERRDAAARREQERSQASQAQETAWEELLRDVQAEKSELNRDDADDAFDTVRAVLGDQNNAVLFHTVDKGNRAKIIYALAKNPERLEALGALSATSNPIAFIKEVTKLEGQLKMFKRRKAPELDTPQRGSAAMSSMTKDQKLAKLEKEAAKTGDRTALVAYKKQLSTQGK